MVSKTGLEIFLSSLSPGSADFRLQQYQTPSEIAARFLWYAFLQGDIAGRTVADFGTGNGILAIGSKYLGAKRVYAIDSDKEMIETAKRNANKLKITFISSDIKDFGEKTDTVVMNPPFGEKPFHKDRDFLQKAFETATRIYSIHTANSADFLSGFAGKKGFGCTRLDEFDFPIKHSFEWHRKAVKTFRAVILFYQPTKS